MLSVYNPLGPIYTKCQHQCYDKSAIMLVIPFSLKTRMHSSRMRTTRSLTVSRRILCIPPATMHTPATMHAPRQPCTPPGNHACPPQPCMPPCNHTCPPTTMHAPGNHACPQQPRMPPSNHALPKLARPPVDRILDTCFWKYYLAPNFVCGR